jgi:hypothetical protein
MALEIVQAGTVRDVMVLRELHRSLEELVSRNENGLSPGSIR